ncbi:MAG: hypothetical protein NTX56_04460 [Proteobacteria bacterium]|nr:hypothetical protein [Pseudomonadota bacterium]
MSATSAPFGFVPIYHPTGNARGTAYDNIISAAYATSLYKYQPVYILNGVLTVGATTGDLLGVFAGVEYQEAGTLRWVESNYYPASTSFVAGSIRAYVWDDAVTVFKVQADGSIGALNIGDQANGSNLTANGSGLSQATLSSTLAGSGSQAQWRIVNLYNDLSNSWGDAYTVVNVQIAQQQYTANKVAI